MYSYRSLLFERRRYVRILISSEKENRSPSDATTVFLLRGEAKSERYNMRHAGGGEGG
jgi:hypothetical protein